MPGSDELRAMVTGFRLSAALSVAAELGLSDQLASGPRRIDDLATAVSADPATLQRLVRALASVGVYAEQPDGAFANTLLGEGLRLLSRHCTASTSGPIGKGCRSRMPSSTTT
jgi:DNA-binding IclR family transcriptional regulator